MEYFINLGITGITLLILSIISLTIITERIYFNIKNHNSNELAILIKTLNNNKDKDKNLRDEIISFQLLALKEKYEYGIKSLRIIATISPMLGLFGTVIGIIKSFKNIANHQGPINPALVADGLWLAMTSTAFGLAIALPCLIFAFIFMRHNEKKLNNHKNKLNRISLELEDINLS
jgi:biopolymer transport protein ExbB